MSQLIYKKMSDVMKEIGSIGKDQKNQAQGFKFRGIDQFVNALYPALTKNGVFMTPRCTYQTQELKEVTRSSGKQGFDKHVVLMMEYDFFAEDGSKVTVGPVPAEGLDSGDKATNKALSASLKYALIQTFSIPTEDMAEADLETPVISGKAEIKPTTKATPEVSTVTIMTSKPEEVVAAVTQVAAPKKSGPWGASKKTTTQTTGGDLY
jgi:hypothetical protein